MSKVKYQQNAIVITLPCADPAAYHAQLLQSIAANLSYSTAALEKADGFNDEMQPMFTLLRSFLPDEKVLSKIS